MTKRSKDSDTLSAAFAMIVPNNEQAVEIANQYSSECGSEKVCVDYKGIEMYQVKFAVFAHIPGYNQTAVSNLYEGLRSFVGSYRYIFLITTAVSCACVKEGANGLISIETIYSLNQCSKEFGFYLPEGAQKMYPATAVSQCNQKFPRIPLTSAVQVLLNLNVMVDALTLPPQFAPTNQLIVMAVNVDKIACKYKQATVRKLLFDDKKHSQDFVRAVVNFVFRIASEDSLTLPMTPPATCKKQRLDHLLLSEMDNKLKETFSKEEYAKQRALIEKFEKDFLVTTLSPDKLPNFARCLGLTDNDYKIIEYDHNHKNPGEQIHCIVKKWFEKEGFDATVMKFSEALQGMNKESYDNFVLYCKESA